MNFFQFWLFIVLITDRLYQLYQLIIFIKLVFLSTQIGTPIGYSNRYPLFSIDHVATSLICNFFFLNRNSPYTFVLIFSNLFLFGLSFVVVILFLTASNFTLSWRRSLFYRNPSIDLRSKSMDWLLYDRHFPSKVLTLTSKTD